MENSACGKVCCCLECEDKDTCDIVCESVSGGEVTEAAACEDAFTEDNALQIMQTKAAAVIEQITALVKQKKRIEEQEKAMKEQLQKAMEEYGVKRFDNDSVSFTYVAPTVANTIDSKALKADLPDVAAKYTKQTNKAGYVKITVK